MANVTAAQILVDGDKNVVVHCTGVLDTSDVASTTVIDVSALAPAAADLIIESLQWSVGGALQVLLWWDATTDDLLYALSESGVAEFSCCSGLRNPRSTGWTGDINLSTIGYSAGTVAYSVTIVATKRGG